MGVRVLDHVFSLSDQSGPALVIHDAQSEIGRCGILAVDNLAAGPLGGDLRRAEAKMESPRIDPGSA